jgi:putative aminopeptidase FrvX
VADRMHEVLSELDAAIGVSGHEDEVAAVIAGQLEGAYDSRDADPLGNQYFTRGGEDGSPTSRTRASCGSGRSAATTRGW